MTMRSPSVSMSTRSPSRRPRRVAMSFGIRSPRLFPQRASATRIMPLRSQLIYEVYRDRGRNGTGSAVDAAEAEVFDFEKFLDAVFRAFAADAAFLHAAERRDFGRDYALVDADDAVFERLGDPEDAADVAAVEIGGETEFGVVRHLYRLRLGLEAVERRDRAERLLFRDDHVGRDTSQHGWLEEAAAERV